MDIENIKSALASVRFEVKAGGIEEIIEELHVTYGSQRIGSSVRSLGKAAPLFIKSGNVAFMVDNANDLDRACLEINRLKEASASNGPIVMKKDTRSQWRSDIESALRYEMSLRSRTGRDLEAVYENYDGGERVTATSIVDDLISDDKKRNTKAVEAFKCLLICK